VTITTESVLERRPALIRQLVRGKVANVPGCFAYRTTKHAFWTVTGTRPSVADDTLNRADTVLHYRVLRVYVFSGYYIAAYDYRYACTT